MRTSRVLCYLHYIGQLLAFANRGIWKLYGDIETITSAILATPAAVCFVFCVTKYHARCIKRCHVSLLIVFYTMVFHFLCFILGRGGLFLIWRWLICFLNGTKFNIYCRLGAHRRRGDVGTEQDFQITRMISHESYRKPYGIAHDIALLKLHKPAMINRNVGLACLPPSSGSVADGKHCWVSGNNTKE